MLTRARRVAKQSVKYLLDSWHVTYFYNIVAGWYRWNGCDASAIGGCLGLKCLRPESGCESGVWHTHFEEPGDWKAEGVGLAPVLRWKSHINQCVTSMRPKRSRNDGSKARPNPPEPRPMRG